MTVNIENLLQFGVAGTIAIYLTWFICFRVIQTQDKIISLLEKIAEAIRADRRL